jgi:hypothetical protein
LVWRDVKGTARRFHVSLNGGVRTRFFSSLFVGVTFPLALASLAVACATGGGGNAGTGGDGGDDGSLVEGGGDGPGAEGRAGEGGEGGAGTSAAKACADNAAQYCTQLSTCSPFLVSIQYGDEITCEMAQTPGCMDALSAPGTGWTGDVLEACVKARSMLSCEDFLYAKPYPKACEVYGTLVNKPCRYDAQCATGYCYIAMGATCGNCIQRQPTGGPCKSAADCDGNLMCSSASTCAAPSGIGGPCSMTVPCQSGLACVGSQCVVPGGVDAGCADAGGTCDYNLGAYCVGSSCAPVTVDTAGGSCMGPPVDQCPGSGECQQMFCVPPTADMGACDGSVACAPPDTCNAGTCSLFSASQCH